MENFIKENRFSILSIIVGISGGIRGFIQFFLKQKQSIELEKLKSQLEQNKLNDQKFRNQYENFIALLFDIIQKKNVNLEKGMLDFMKTTLLFAGPETLKQFGLYRKTAGDKTQTNILKNMGELIIAMRKDLGVSNKNINRKDIIQSFIIENVDTLLKENKKSSE